MTQVGMNGVFSRFSLSHYYRREYAARVLNTLIISLLCILIIGSPLPFGSVEYSATFLLEVVASLSLSLCWIKLVLCADPNQLSRFRTLHHAELERYRNFPFFHKWVWASRILRVLTLGTWPRKNVASNLWNGEGEVPGARLAYFSVFGYPVRNTGIEKIALGFLCLLCVQLIPFPDFLIGILSPTCASLYRTAAAATRVQQSFFSFSISPFATFSKILEYSAYFMLYLVVVNGTPSRKYFRALLIALTVSVGFQGIYGLLEFLSGHQYIFAYKKKMDLHCATGTFIDRNHYAAYLELVFPLLLSLLAGRLNHLLAFTGSIWVRVSRLLEARGGKIILLLLAVLVTGISILFSLSRSGIAFSAVSVAMFLFFYRRAAKQVSQKGFWLLAAAFVFAAAVWIGMEPVLERFLKIPAQEARLTLYLDTARIIYHFPLTGTGAGTFQSIFPMYRSFAGNDAYVYAHNDYLQFFSEDGIFVVLLLIAFIDSMRMRFLDILSWKISRVMLVQIAVFCSLLTLGLHSLTDSSLQIPAVAVAGCMIAGLFWSNPRAEGKIF